MAVLCTKRDPSLCEEPATHVLRIREPGSAQWDDYPRCAGHPAAGEVAEVMRLAPDAEVRIEPLEAEVSL